MTRLPVAQHRLRLARILETGSYEERSMSEQPADTPRAEDEDGSHASVGRSVDRSGGGRTEGETRVDDELGSGDEA